MGKFFKILLSLGILLLITGYFVGITSIHDEFNQKIYDLKQEEYYLNSKKYQLLNQKMKLEHDKTLIVSQPNTEEKESESIVKTQPKKQPTIVSEPTPKRTVSRAS